jgi:hypothetical protein
MGKIKELILDHRGYTIRGVVEVENYSGTHGYVAMHPQFISNRLLTHTAIKKAVNDAGYGCKHIMEAKLDIFDTYGAQNFEVKNRSITLDKKQCFFGTRGIKQH